TEHHPHVRQERRGLGGVDQGVDRVVVPVGRADLDLLDHQGVVLGADEVVHEVPDGLAADDLVAALDQGDGDRAGGVLGHRRASATAATTSAVRRAAGTLSIGTRRSRAPSEAARARAPRAAPSTGVPGGRLVATGRPAAQRFVIRWRAAVAPGPTTDPTSQVTTAA